MQTNEAKIRHAANDLSDPIVYPDDAGWVLSFTVVSDPGYVHYLHRARGELAVFKSIDAAASAAVSIGFDHVHVELVA